MKIIQSFWSKPFVEEESSLEGLRLHGGWPHRKLHYCSWVLSCLQLTKFYSSVELVTDDLGKEILVDKLQLPYKKVSTELNEIAGCDASLRTLGNLHAHRLQREAFLHVDSDVFIWRRFSPRLSGANLVAQNLQAKSFDLSGILNKIITTFPYVPDYLRVHHDKIFVPGSNAGIVGGRDIHFFQTYVNEVLLFLESNAGMIRSSLKYMNADYLNIILEQVVFHALAEKLGKPVTYLFSKYDDIPRALGLFHATGPNKHSIHCLGDFKRHSVIYLVLEGIIKKTYPGYYHRIEDLVATYEL